MRHDIDYALAKGSKNKQEQVKKIREADKRMVIKLNQIAKNKGDAKKNIFQGRRLIQAKMAGEDLGIMNKGSFSGDLGKISDSDKILLMSKKAGLEQEGYGMLPGENLKMKLMKSMKRKKGKGKGKCKKGPKSRKGLKGKGGSVLDFISKGLIPNLAKDLGIDLTHVLINSIMKMMKTTKPTSLPKITSVLTKSILPYLVKGKIHNLGHSGCGIMDVIKKIPKNLEKLLNIGIHKALKWFMSKMGQGGKGVNLPGGSWGSF
jgi:hypothetical protein